MAVYLTFFVQVFIFKAPNQHQQEIKDLWHIWSIWSVYLRTYIWGRFSVHLRPILYRFSIHLRLILYRFSIHLRPILYRFPIHLRLILYRFSIHLRQNLSDWLRHITWQNKLSLPQMYRESASNVQNSLSEPIRELYIWGRSVHFNENVQIL